MESETRAWCARPDQIGGGWLMVHIDQTSRRIVSAAAGCILALAVLRVARARQAARG